MLTNGPDGLTQVSYAAEHDDGPPLLSIKPLDPSKTVVKVSNGILQTDGPLSEFWGRLWGAVVYKGLTFFSFWVCDRGEEVRFKVA